MGGCEGVRVTSTVPRYRIQGKKTFVAPALRGFTLQQILGPKNRSQKRMPRFETPEEEKTNRDVGQSPKAKKKPQSTGWSYDGRGGEGKIKSSKH